MCGEMAASVAIIAKAGGATKAKKPRDTEFHSYQQKSASVISTLALFLIRIELLPIRLAIIAQALSPAGEHRAILLR